MAQIAAVYTVEPYVRTPEDIAGTLGPSPTYTEPPERPRPEDKRVWASVTDEAFDVIGEALAEAERRDPEHTKTWLILVDGGELENYVTVRLLRVLQGKASHVAAGMQRSATLQGATKEQRRPIDRCANYLLKYARPSGLRPKPTLRVVP
jgi:hypothetical protein